MDDYKEELSYRVPITSDFRVGQRILLETPTLHSQEVVIPQKKEWKEENGKYYFIFRVSVPKFRKWDDFDPGQSDPDRSDPERSDPDDSEPNSNSTQRTFRKSVERFIFFMKVPPSSRRKALLIGIDYIGTESYDVVESVYNMRRFLTDETNKLCNGNGFKDSPENMMVLVNNQNYRLKYARTHQKELEKLENIQLPTRENIIKGVKWLVDGALTGDVLFFQFCGIYVERKDKRTFYPLDYFKGTIDYKEICESLVCLVPDGVKLFIIMDGYPNGQCLDLLYKYEPPKTKLQLNVNERKPEKFKDSNYAGDIVQFSMSKADEDVSRKAGHYQSISNAFIHTLRKSWDPNLNDSSTYRSLPHLLTRCVKAMRYRQTDTHNDSPNQNHNDITYSDLLNRMERYVSPATIQFTTSQRYDLSDTVSFDGGIYPNENTTIDQPIQV